MVSGPRTHPCRSPTRGDSHGQPWGPTTRPRKSSRWRESCPAPIGMKATAPPRHGPPALTQRPGPFLTRLSPPAFSLLPPLEALRPAPTLRSHPKDGGHRCPHFHLTLPASLLLLCRPHSVGGHSSLRSGRGLAPRLPRPSTVNLGPGPTEGSRGTPSSARPAYPHCPGTLAHLRGGAPRLLIWLWAWATSCPAFCRYMDGK